MRMIVTLVAALAMAAPAAAKHHESAMPEAKQAMESALQHSRRDGDRARDEFRNPAETLKFFKVKPGMTVIDFGPGGGWYTRVLVPYLGKDGRYVGLNPAVPPGASERMAQYIGGLSEKFPPKAAEWNLSGAKVEAYNTDQLGEEWNGTVDRVLIIRGMHNLFRNGVMHSELTRLHALLKDGGKLGIVQHRAKAWAPASYTTGMRGYLRQKDVIGLVEAYGFELVATSEINANPKDSADHDGGVWDLPPVMRTKREELRSVGESDRMTLLFRKRS